MKKVEHFKAIIGEMIDTFERKNADYGSSVFELGPVGAVISLHHKLKRVMTISSHEIRVTSESLRDTLLDAANYAIIALMALEIADGEETESDDTIEVVLEDDEETSPMTREERIDSALDELFRTDQA